MTASWMRPWTIWSGETSSAGNRRRAFRPTASSSSSTCSRARLRTGRCHEPRDASVTARSQRSSSARRVTASGIPRRSWLTTIAKPVTTRRRLCISTMAADVASRAWAKQQAIILLGEAIEIAERIADRDLLIGARLARASTLIDAARFTDSLEDLDWLIEERRVGISPSRTSPVRGPPSGSPTPPVWSRTAPPRRTSRSDSTTASSRVAHSPRDPRPRPCRETSRQRSRRGSGSKTRGRRNGATHSYARFLATRSLMSYWTGDYETCLAWRPRHTDRDRGVEPRGGGHERLQRGVGARRSLATRRGHRLARPSDPARSRVGGTIVPVHGSRDEHAGGRPPRDR